MGAIHTFSRILLYVLATLRATNYAGFCPVMVDLPRELWDCITSYLDDKEAWKLRNVNHILRQIIFVLATWASCTIFKR
ncbi:hypothetical protein CPB83DRAFT_860086 [Crepidotus variabilis]|uniref:F-box domain-containing protein n=1 Tax=Crepidotus variabilis TaxID=179855 RepID=A0A9P6JLB5_9AGAR|nr:hypothetical protein CPB83DRAFT_860086 [Crepidotus variabilis]